MLLELQIAGIIFAIVGALFNIFKMKWCWLFWVVANIIFIRIYLVSGLHVSIALQFVYIAMNIYGWIKWSKEGSKTMTKERLSNEDILAKIEGKKSLTKEQKDLCVYLNKCFLKSETNPITMALWITKNIKLSTKTTRKKRA